MIDLDSNPTKLLEVVEVGKQLLMTAGRLRRFRWRTTSPSTSQSFRDFMGFSGDRARST